MHSSIDYHHCNTNQSGDLLHHLNRSYSSRSNCSDTNTESSYVCAPSAAQILFQSKIDSLPSSYTTTASATATATGELSSEIVERYTYRSIISPNIELEFGNNGDNNNNNNETSENMSNNINKNMFSPFSNREITYKSKHEMSTFTNTIPHEQEVGALSSFATNLLTENDQVEEPHENREHCTWDVNRGYNNNTTKNVHHEPATEFYQKANVANWNNEKEQCSERKDVLKELKNENQSMMNSVNTMHTWKNSKWYESDILSRNAEIASASFGVVHAKMYFEPVHSQHELSAITPIRLRVPSLWFANSARGYNSNLTKFVKPVDKDDFENFHNLQKLLSPPMPPAKTTALTCEEGYREHTHISEHCKEQESCSNHVNHTINSNNSSDSSVSRRSVSTTEFDKENAFDHLVVSGSNEPDHQQHGSEIKNRDYNSNTNSNNERSRREQEWEEGEEYRNKEQWREHKNDGTYHNYRKNEMDKQEIVETALRENSSNVLRTESDERITTQNNSDAYKTLHCTPKSEKESLKSNKNKKIRKSNTNQYSSRISNDRSHGNNENNNMNTKSEMHQRSPHESLKHKTEMRTSKLINKTNSISVPNMTLHQNHSGNDPHKLEISKPITSASIRNLPTTLVLPYSTNTLNENQSSVPLHELNSTTLHSLPSAQTTLNTRASARLLASGDWFYKWNRDGSHVSPRWVWVDTRSHLLAWAHKETTSNMFSHSIPLEMIWQVTPRELVQPLWRGQEHRIYYVLQIQSTQRVLQIATQQKRKVDLWYEALVNVLSFVRRHDVNRSTSIPDEAHHVQKQNTYNSIAQMNRMTTNTTNNHKSSVKLLSNDVSKIIIYI